MASEVIPDASLSEENLPTADQLRLIGNQHFSEGNYDMALPTYTLAIEMLSSNDSSSRPDEVEDLDEYGVDMTGACENEDGEHDELVVHLCNRSACFFKMERFEEARDDASEAVRLSNGRNPKAAFRLARTQIELRKYTDAILTLDAALVSLETQQEELGDLDEDRCNKFQEQRNELRRLQAFAKKKRLEGKVEKPNVSIKSYELGRELGLGNFSRVVVCSHKVTGKEYSLKIIEKKKAESLAKRQHPNVYNEIKMEKRVLSERLPGDHPLIILMYHAFQDYNSLYFLMDLHVTGGELWARLMYKNKLVGCHHSLARFYLAELVEALEHIHSRGIVHRDLKAENVLISSTGHIVVIDFGTAKDLIETDLNGPEFVGTPEFMSPEAVKGGDGNSPGGADHTADLWALGCLAHQLYTGKTPFTSQSPYLSFLKIQRANLYRPLAIEDDDAWDLMVKLLQLDPSKRIGANCVPDEESPGKIKPERGDLSEIKNHKYFSRGMPVDDGVDPSTHGGELRMEISNIHKQKAQKIPSLKDLCVRECAELARIDSLDLDAGEPGDGSGHDMLRLNNADRSRVMHVLDSLKLLGEPRVFRRFFKSKLEAKANRVRKGTRDYVGLTRTEQGPVQSSEDDPPTEVKFIHITNPLFAKERNINCSEQQRKDWMKELRNCVKMVNRKRPKFVVASGYIDESCRKVLSKTNETVPLVLNDGSVSFSFWYSGTQFLVLQASDLLHAYGSDDMVNDGNTDTNTTEVQQRAWLSEELEQIRMGQRHTFVFVDCDPVAIPQPLLRKLARGKTMCVLGCSDGEFQKEYYIEDKNEAKTNSVDNYDSDVESDEEENESDISGMCRLSGKLKMVTVEEGETWNVEDLWPSTSCM